MRRFIGFAAFLCMLAVELLAFGGYAVAVTGPFRPGMPLFPAQDFAEQARALWIEDETEKADYYLELAERRAEDLARLIGASQEPIALEYLDQAASRAVQGAASAPEIDRERLQERLAEVIYLYEGLFNKLTVVPSENPDLYWQVHAALSRMYALVKQPVENQAQVGVLNKPGSEAQLKGLAESIQPTPEGILPRPREVLFPPGSAGARHAFFALSGRHAEIECQACHSDNRYTGAPRECQACHLPELPTNHYDGECSLCHTSTAWRPVNFDHQAIRAAGCAACHAKNKPANHYSGQCSACHSTNAWKPANFNHQAVGTDCAACHANNKPANHYSGQCSACHSISSWRPASFNHQAAGATDCAACHANNKPADHPDGQCSSCHATNAWQPAGFNHESAGASDCAACHSGNQPANHYSGQCSACHTTSSWQPAGFNHESAGASDCAACHSGNKPSNHYSGQCSSCHSTSAWKPANFSHTFPIDHKDAKGECAKCHPSGDSAWTCYNCHNQEKTEKKHTEKNILDIASRCIECHAKGKKK